MTHRICVRPTCHRRTQRHAKKYTQGLCDLHARQAGLLKPWVGADKALVEIARLHDGGWDNRRIGKESGLNHNTITFITTGRTEATRQVTLDALKALPTEAPHRRPAWPIHRRIQSLRGAGHTTEEIAEAVGVKFRTIQGVQRGLREWVPTELDQSIRTYFDQHKFAKPRPMSKAMTRLQLPRPMAWNNIDDPHEPWPKPVRNKKGDGSGHLGATPMFYNNFDLVLKHIGNQNEVAKTLSINFKTLAAWKNRTADTVTVNQYQRVNNHAKRIRKQYSQATEHKDAA